MSLIIGCGHDVRHFVPADYAVYSAQAYNLYNHVQSLQLRVTTYSENLGQSPAYRYYMRLLRQRIAAWLALAGGHLN